MWLYILYKTLKQAKKVGKTAKNVWECRLRNGRWFIVHTGTGREPLNYRTEQIWDARKEYLVW